MTSGRTQFNTLSQLIAEYHDARLEGRKLTAEQVTALQTELNALDKLLPKAQINLGHFGENHDGVDGRMGKFTRASIAAAERALAHIDVTNITPRPTAPKPTPSHREEHPPTPQPQQPERRTHPSVPTVPTPARPVPTPSNTKTREFSEEHPDPSHVHINFHMGDGIFSDRRMGHITATKTVDHPTTYSAEDAGVQNRVDVITYDHLNKTYPQKGVADKWVIDTLRKHVRKYGAIQELIINGHGSSNWIGSHHREIRLPNIEGFVAHIGDLEKELGVKIANRVVFHGCSTFSELTDGQIKYFRDFAKEHKMELVGATSMEFQGRWAVIPRLGRIVQFSPTGEIIRDKLDSKWNPLANLGVDTSWTDAYLGHTLEEGAALRKSQDIQRENEKRAAEHWQKKQNWFADHGPKIL